MGRKWVLKRPCSIWLPPCLQLHHGLDPEIPWQHLNCTNCASNDCPKSKETPKTHFFSVSYYEDHWEGWSSFQLGWRERAGWQGNLFASIETLNLGFPALSSLHLDPLHLWMFWESGKRHLFTIGLLETAEGLFPGMMEKASLWISGLALSIWVMIWLLLGFCWNTRYTLRHADPCMSIFLVLFA